MNIINQYSYRLDIWKSVCDTKSIQYTTNSEVAEYLIIHLKKDFTFYGRKDSFNSPIASMVTKHKSVTYKLLKNSTVPIPLNIVINKKDDLVNVKNKIELSKIGFPLIIKPSNTDNSIHIYIVDSMKDLFEKIDIIFTDNTYNITEVIIQQYINIKQEYRVLVFNKNISKNAANSSKILLAYSKLKLSQRKHSDNFEEKNIQDIDCEIVKSRLLLDRFQVIVDEIATHIPSLCWSGIDIIEDTKGDLWFLEVNSDPGFKHLRKFHGDEVITKIYSDMLCYMQG